MNIPSCKRSCGLFFHHIEPPHSAECKFNVEKIKIVSDVHRETDELGKGRERDPGEGIPGMKGRDEGMI